MRKFIVLDTEGFPSPLGEMRLSIAVVKYESGEGYIPFPSPLGEKGLSIQTELTNCKRLLSVSVPSRGKGVIDLPTARLISSALVSFPSPLGEKGLSIQ